MIEERERTGIGAGRVGGPDRGSKIGFFATLAAGIVATAVVGGLALARSGSQQPVTPSAASQQAALDWTQHNQQMWSWMQTHWPEMTLVHQHWGDTVWMQSNLPDWGWMQARWGSMVRMHENWQAITWMHAGGMMGGSAPGGMMGRP